MLPPTLRTVLPHIPPPKYPARIQYDWKKPLVISTHAHVDETGKALVSIFLVGIDTLSFGRKFEVKACLFGNQPVPVVQGNSVVVMCEVQKDLLREGETVSVLLEFNEALSGALAGLKTLGGETVTLTGEDVKVENINGFGKVGIVNSIVKWNNVFIENSSQMQPRYRLCLMSAMKQYPYLLQPWINYFRAKGVDRVYIYENNADESLAKLLDPDYVEVVPWPFPRSQLQSNNHFLHSAANRCRYVAFFDADEFPILPLDISLIEYIQHRTRANVGQVIFLHLNMLNDGYIRRPKGAVPERYFRRERDQQIKLGKPVIDMNKSWLYHRIHTVQGFSNTYWNSTLELNPTSLEHNSMLVHYTLRSWEEYVLKNKVGGASVMTTGRPPRELDITKPDPEYMDLAKTIPYKTFKLRYTRALKNKNNSVVLEWRDEQASMACTQIWCPKCFWRGKLYKRKCRKIGDE